MTTPEFLDVAADVLRRAGARPGASPASLVARWADFVAECAAGYAWDHSEYVNELFVRDLLEALLAASELQAFPEIGGLREQVDLVDADLRALLNPTRRLPVGGPWWRTGVLAASGADYAAYMRDAYGIPVRTHG
jgi:hypothetical protein